MISTKTKDVGRAISAATGLSPRAWGPVGAAVCVATALGALAFYNVRRTRADEREHPPTGNFITVDGVRLHYIDKGVGPVVTLIHGNMLLGEDFSLSGVVDKLVEHHRVIVFDRPRFGYSDRPHRLWTPRAYAELLQTALTQIGVGSFTIVGHSYGTLIALELALEHPSQVEGLVLIGGYFYPSARADSLMATLGALPGVSEVTRYTISPPLTRALLPAVLAKLFSPSAITDKFAAGFPKSFPARPEQIGAETEDGASMTPSAMKLQDRYPELKHPIVILAGEGDKIVNFERQSERFHKEVAQSELIVIPAGGHMAHHVEPNQVVAAVDRVTADMKKSTPRERVDTAA